MRYPTRPPWLAALVLALLLALPSLPGPASARARGACGRRPPVPAVMYFTGAVAFHGAYWHHAFGTGRRVSHGCVNLRVADAVWLYTWAPIGTAVWVHY